MAKTRGKYEKASPKRPVLLPVLLVVILLVVTSTAMLLAYYLRDGGSLMNIFKTEQVSCTVEEVFVNNVKSDIKVKNTSTVDVYIRVRLVSYWKTPSGKITGKTSETPNLTEGRLGAGWMADEANDTYYYTKRVAVNGTTPDLLKEGATIELKNTDGYIQVIEVLAEAIQADGERNNKLAVEEAWGVTVAEGIITKVTP